MDGSPAREISDMFLDHAVEEYNKRDMLQASEKAWGALPTRRPQIRQR